MPEPNLSNERLVSATVPVGDKHARQLNWADNAMTLPVIFASDTVVLLEYYDWKDALQVIVFPRRDCITLNFEG